MYSYKVAGRHSIVSIATWYRLDSLGLYPGGMRLYVLFGLEPRPTRPPVQLVPSHAQELEQPEHGGEHLPFSSTGL
jgi:hypothetical protein